MAKPVVALDLENIDRNFFLVIGYAAQKLIDTELTAFYEEVLPAIPPSSGKSYEDILALVNHHVCLVDTSGTYSEYAIDDITIMAIIRRLNEQLKALPPYVTSLVEDVHPDLSSEWGLVNYIGLLEQQIECVEQEIESGLPRHVLLAILQEGLVALQTVLNGQIGTNAAGIPLLAPTKRHRSSKQIYVEFVTSSGHIATSDFRDNLPNGVRAVIAIVGKWTNMTPGNVQEQYAGGRVYGNITGRLLCYAVTEDGALHWFNPNGEPITDLSALGVHES